ncbi:membrane protein, partial [human gut metagenome]
DAFFVGLALNLLGLVIGSSVTRVSEKENEQRELLLKTPIEEYNEKEIKVTRRYLVFYIIAGVAIMLMLVFLWAVPYMKM